MQRDLRARWPARLLRSIPFLDGRGSAQLRAKVLLAMLFAISIGLSAWLCPRDIFIFRADWFLHPNEQEHLTISRHFAETGSLVIRDEWYGQSPAHGSEDKGYRDGALVPRSSILSYTIFAVPFLFSDTAWRFVTPFFGLAAAIFSGLIVHRRTASRLAGVATGVSLISTASVLLNSGGLALENVIALAFLLAAVFYFEEALNVPSARAGLLTGLMFGAAAATRADLAPAAAIACAILAWRILREKRTEKLPHGQVVTSVLAIGTMAATAAALVIFNRSMYGEFFSTGYGDQAWQGSASGVGTRVLDISIGDFKDMAWSFLFRIGKMQTLLLFVGVGWLIFIRRLRPADAVLLGLAGALLVLHLGNDSVTGGSGPYLVNSTARYLQPVYATGVLLGVEALYRFSWAMRLTQLTRGIAFGAILLLAVSVSLSEAYGDTWAIPSADRDAKEFRAVHEFAKEHRGALFVGDYNTKAIITDHTLIPRLLPEPGQLAAYLEQELASGTAVYVVDTSARRDPSNGYYSDYLAQLNAAGFYVTLLPDTPGYLQVSRPSWHDDDIRRLLATLPNGRGESQLVENSRLVRTAGGQVTGWSSNGQAWNVPVEDGGQGVRIRNTAQYGGIRQQISGASAAGETVSGFAAVQGLSGDGAARQVLLGLYDDRTYRPVVEAYGRLEPGKTTYLAIEASLPPDAPPLRLVVASARLDSGDYIIEQVALVRGSLEEMLGR